MRTDEDASVSRGIFLKRLIINNNAMSKDKYIDCAKRILENLNDRSIQTDDIDKDTLKEIEEEIAEEIKNVVK